jgi:hypothetical protein
MADMDRVVVELDAISRTLNRIESLVGWLAIVATGGLIGMLGTWRQWF